MAWLYLNQQRLRFKRSASEASEATMSRDAQLLQTIWSGAVKLGRFHSGARSDPGSSLTLTLVATVYFFQLL